MEDMIVVFGMFIMFAIFVYTTLIGFLHLCMRQSCIRSLRARLWITSVIIDHIKHYLYSL